MYKSPESKQNIKTNSRNNLDLNFTSAAQFKTFDATQGQTNQNEKQDFNIQGTTALKKTNKLTTHKPLLQIKINEVANNAKNFRKFEECLSPPPEVHHDRLLSIQTTTNRIRLKSMNYLDQTPDNTEYVFPRRKSSYNGSQTNGSILKNKKSSSI